jgi:hypothetical protein
MSSSVETDDIPLYRAAPSRCGKVRVELADNSDTVYYIESVARLQDSDGLRVPEANWGRCARRGAKQRGKCGCACAGR